MKTTLHGGAMLAVALSCPVAAQADPLYTVNQGPALGPAGRWDYTAIDQHRHRLYLSRGDHVQVLQLPAGQPLAEIADTPHVHGFAFAQELGIGFISNGARDSVTVFDLDTMRPRKEIKTGGANPDALLYEPASQQLFTFNGKTHNVSVIDARTLATIVTITATGRPESAVSDGAGRIYFNIEDNAGINVIDVATNSIVARWKLDGCDEPSGLAIDAAHHRLFSTCQNRVLAVTDSLTGKRIANVPIGEHPDAAEFDAARGLVFTSNGGGTGSPTIVHEDDPDHYTVLQSVPTTKGAKTMAFDPESKIVYLPAAVKDSFVVLVATPR
jgi:DNA-binding beta-propeller fold protein YncE